MQIPTNHPQLSNINKLNNMKADLSFTILQVAILT